MRDYKAHAPLTVLASGMLLLSACSTGPQHCDPSRTDFFSGVGCMSDGGYQQRARALQSESNSAQANAILARQKAIEAEHAASNAQNTEQTMSTTMHSQMGALKSETNLKRAEVDRLARSKTELLQQKNALEAQMQAAKQKLATIQGEPNPNAEEIQRIQKQISDLHNQIKTMTELANSGG